MKRKLLITYYKRLILARLWCSLFGHRFHNDMWNGGGDEMCNRCTKYKECDGYWFYNN